VLPDTKRTWSWTARSRSPPLSAVPITSVFFFSSRRRHTRSKRDWSSDVCSSDLTARYLPLKQIPWSAYSCHQVTLDHSHGKANTRARGRPELRLGAASHGPPLSKMLKLYRRQ